MKTILILLLLCCFQASGQIIRKPGENYSIPVMPGTGQPDSDLETIRNRVIADLLAPAVDPEEITRLIRTQQKDGTWPEINYKDVSRTGFQHSRHLNNMLVLGRAFKKEGTSFQGDPAVRNAVSTALDYWITNDFICENWWWNEMGTPHLMVNILLVMDSDLSSRQKTEGVRIAGRANLEASGARPGGDLIQIAGMLGKQALFQRNPEVLSKVVLVMASEIKISGGRGLKPDLSFHHRTDNVISTLAYGTGYAASFAYWAVKIAGTKYTLPEPALHLLVDYYLDGICQSLVHGKYPDPGAENRGITRKEALKEVSADLPENLLAATSYRKAELENIVRIRKGETASNLTRDYYFWHSHYYTHQRPDYYTSVRMHSNRASNMEQPHNEEGLKNHHYGDGSNFISRTGQEYEQIFPVWDWQKIPGTTVVQKPEVAHWKHLARQGRKDFTGGVTDQRYGAAAFDFESVHDPLSAKKAWFFFDKEVVSLGAGIRSTADYPVATTLNQCLLKSKVVVKSEGRKQELEAGKHDLGQVNWVIHDEVGYVFLNPTELKLSNQIQAGNWRMINHQAWATEEIVEKQVFTLWLDHGVKPQNETYQYVVVPGINETDLEMYAQSKPVNVISNTTDLQAVEHAGLGIAQAVLYKPGKVQFSNGLIVSADNPCLIMLSRSGDKIKSITVSDPTGKLKKLKIEVNSKLAGTGAHWQTTYDSSLQISTISFSLPEEGMAGKSITADVVND
ncbi:polysaccharide lyase family 8 super-sandwich domain-containing protein [Dyadobacter sp. CY312]|uniref:polysaccharide lyase family 8 super-sandwich domain-containing protein n=1 Tax=Dyadobacter sp. CY312 TaxID=2907303 RepID=UPI001F37DE92|nr:polysaccharide lyase family 8 super-sandwich domain-containing protein [Dyadobacter sp. CY312]MCE7043219.1 polysaccharide lyase beta-sandwich domain-containing protein [Dyadobacter sp. CY312]